MDTQKKQKRRLIEQLDNETRQTLMRLYLERRALHEFSKLVEAGLEEDQILIPNRCDRRPPDDDVDHSHDW